MKLGMDRAGWGEQTLLESLRIPSALITATTWECGQMGFFQVIIVFREREVKKNPVPPPF